MEADHLLINLKVLGKLTPGDILSTKFRHYQIIKKEDNWIPTFITRWWFGESRNIMINDIEKLISDIENGLKSEKFEYYDQIIESLRESRTGITELKKRYAKDAYTVSRLELINNKINVLISNHQN